MKIKIQREKVLELLSNVVGIVNSGISISSCVKIMVTDKITMVTTDGELEMSAETLMSSNEIFETGDFCVNAKKLLEIIKALPPESIVSLDKNDDGCSINQGKSKFKLSTLPVDSFPSIRQDDQLTKTQIIPIDGSELGKLLSKTAFSMAVNDVRYVLNGMLFEIKDGYLNSITTNGHRLSICKTRIDDLNYSKMAIIPKKAVKEIGRFGGSDKEIELKINNSSLELGFIDPKSKFNSSLNLYVRLIDGKFPDYKRIIPHGNDIIARINRQDFISAINRVSILSNEKLRGVYITYSQSEISLRSSNPEQDEAIEFFAIDYDFPEMELNFNSQYLLEALNAIDSEEVIMEIADPIKAVTIQNPDDPSQIYIVMPMRV